MIERRGLPVRQPDTKAAHERIATLTAIIKMLERARYERLGGGQSSAASPPMVAYRFEDSRGRDCVARHMSCSPMQFPARDAADSLQLRARLRQGTVTIDAITSDLGTSRAP